MTAPVRLSGSQLPFYSSVLPGCAVSHQIVTTIPTVISESHLLLYRLLGLPVLRNSRENMALSTAVLRRHAVRPSAPASRRMLAAPMPRQTACKSQLLSTLAAAGDVDAPIGVVVGA